MVIRNLILMMCLCASGLAQLRTWEELGNVAGSTMGDVTWGRDRFVAVGFTGTVIYSLDGETWNDGTVPSLPALSGIFFDGEWFFAMGAGTIFRSADGADFHSVFSGSGWFKSMACHEGTLVTVGDDGVIRRSTNEGVTWDPVTSPTDKDLRQVVYWADRFVAVGNERTILTSFDGTTWNQTHQELSADRFMNLAACRNELLAVDEGGAVFATSNFGSWTEKTTYGVTSSTYDMANFGSLLVRSTTNYFAYSSDGVHWARELLEEPFHNGAYIASNGAIWVAIAWNGDGLICRAPKKKHWQAMVTSETLVFNDLIRTDKAWFAVGQFGMISTTANGSDWTHQFVSGTTSLNGIAQDDDRLVAVGAGGKIFTSLGGVTWTSVTSPTANNLADVAHNGIRWLAVGDNGTAITSTNGTSWTLESTGTAVDLHGVTDNSMAEFWAVGDGGTLVVRSGGGSWSFNNVPSSENMHGIARHPAVNRTYVVGENGTAYVHNGSWSAVNVPTTNHLHGVALDPDGFGVVIVGDEGVILESPDANIFSRTSSFTSNNLNAVATSNDTYMVAGFNGSAGMTGPSILGQPALVFEGPTQSLFKKIIHENGLYLALSFKNGLATSLDGDTWTYLDVFPASHTYGDLIWDGSQFIAVAGAIISLSPDGYNWTSTNHGLGITLTSIAYNGAVYVLGSFSGSVAYGPDLSSLTVVATSNNAANQVFWDGTFFQGFGGSSSNVVYSSNGSSWTPSSITGSDEPISMAKNQDVWVMVGKFGLSWFSSDGLTWTEGGSLGGSTSVAWAGNKFLASGNDDLHLSSDGKNWFPLNLGMSGSNLFWDEHGLLMTRSPGSFLGTIWRIPSAVLQPWNSFRSRVFSSTLFGLAFNGCRLIAVGSNGQAMFSDDGHQWCSVDTGSSDSLFSVAWIGDRFLAVGVSGRVLSSPDGLSWTPETLGASTSLYSVFWDGDDVFAGGNDGLLYRSTDSGVSWTQVHDFFDDVDALTSRAGRIVAVGKSGLIASSTNGTFWQVHASGTSSNFTDVAVTDSGFLAIGLNGVMASSSNGTAWQLLPTFTSDHLRAIQVFGDHKVISGDDGVWTHDGGENWRFEYIASGAGAREIVQARGQFIGVGSNTRIWQSSWGVSSLSPFIESQTNSQEVCDGGNISLNIVARGGEPLKYQWVKDGVPISGSSATRTISGFDAADQGSYSCRIWNTSGSVLSDAIDLTLGTGFTGRLASEVYVQGLFPVELEVTVDCDVNQVYVSWEDLTSMTHLGSGVNPLVLNNPYPQTSLIEVSVQDTVTLNSFDDQTLVLVSENPIYFDINSDGCNTVEDISFVCPSWAQAQAGDPNDDGVFNILDYVYINTSGSCL